MARLYAAARLHVNFFQPSFNLKEKRREGAKVIKRFFPRACFSNAKLIIAASAEWFAACRGNLPCAAKPVSVKSVTLGQIRLDTQRLHV